MGKALMRRVSAPGTTRYPFSAISMRYGHQRFWYWRGWRVRYTYLGPAQPDPAAAPILLIHGFGSSLNQWRDNLLPLSQVHPVYALDLLGFGQSEKIASLLGSNLWSAQVFEFWQTFIGRPAILLGHSLGALVALTTASRYPETAERLIMLTLPAARQELVAGWLDVLSRRVESVVASPLLLRPLFRFVRRRAFLRSVLTKIYLNAERIDEELVDGFALPAMERGAARTLCYLVDSRTQADFSPSTKAILRQLDLPMLLLWGLQDRVVPLNWGEADAAANPQLVFKPIPEAGHCLFDEYPDEVNRIILDWLQSPVAVPEQVSP